MAEVGFMRQAIALAREGMQANCGGPFGAVVVRDGIVLGCGYNRVLIDNDPTAHAEMVSIRQACRALKVFKLAGCDLYTNCEPCPMCLGAVLWARIDRIYYANTRTDAAAIGFDDECFYRESRLPLDERQLPMIQLLREEALGVFREWLAKADRQNY